MSARSLAIGLCCAAVLALNGCQGKDSATPAADAAAAANADVLRVVAADYAFESPDQFTPGVTTIRLVNKGPSPHHIELVKLDQGKTLADYLATLKTPGPPPPWATMIGGPNAPVPGDSTTAIFPLEPGSYAMVCFIPAADGMPHVMKGMARMLTIAGPARTAAEPTPDVTVKLVDYDFQFSQPLTAGHHTIRVENTGQQWHELVLARLEPGKTAMDLAAWADKQAGPPPGALQGGVTGILPGAHAFVVTDLSPGDYALICFFPDIKDGKPHLAHGMIKTITVS